MTFGVPSAVITLLLSWIGDATAGGDLCQRSSPLSLVGFVVFLGLMGAAGFMTTRAGGTVAMATLAGLVGALVSAVGTVIAFAMSSFDAGQCFPGNTTGISSRLLVEAAAIVVALVLSLLGLGVGAGAGAIGGLMGRRPAATTV